MNFSAPKRRPRPESIVPMINVVFLLLIFFLMTAQIAPPDPFEVNPPKGDIETPGDGTLILFISAQNVVAFRSLTGDPAIEALIEETGEGPLLLRADAELPAVELAKLLTRLRKAGIKHIELLVEAG